MDRAAGCHFIGPRPSPWGSLEHSKGAGLALVPRMRIYLSQIFSSFI